MKIEDLQGMKVTGIVGADRRLHNMHIHSCKFANNCDEIKAAQREAMERCLAVAEEYPETPEVARDIRALIEEE